MLRSLSLCLCLLGLAACSSVSVSDYSDVGPQLALEEFFSGPLTAHGVVKDRSGRVIRHFSADIVASWQGGVGTLEEDFVFNDGEKQQRTWILTPKGEGRYTGTAGDVVGAGELEVAGNSVFLDYTLRLPWRGDTIDVRVDDRMYLVGQDVLINESVLSKFGLRVGELLLVIQRVPGSD